MLQLANMLANLNSYAAADQPLRLTLTAAFPRFPAKVICTNFLKTLAQHKVECVAREALIDGPSKGIVMGSRKENIL
jgi:hypothetical protein